MTFKIGDRVQLSPAGEIFYWSKDWLGEMIVVGSPNRGDNIWAVHPKQGGGSFNPVFLEHYLTFKVDDRVQLKDQNQYGGAWKGPMVIEEITAGNKMYYCRHSNGIGGFFYDDLEFYNENEVKEVEKMEKYWVINSTEDAIGGAFESEQEALDYIKSESDYGDFSDDEELYIVKTVRTVNKKVTWE